MLTSWPLCVSSERPNSVTNTSSWAAISSAQKMGWLKK